MRFGQATIRLYVLPLLALACLAGQEPAGGQMVELRVTAVRKSDGDPVALKREDLRLLEDNKPQELLAIRQQNDPPLSMAILIDTSGSQKHVFQLGQQAAYAFVDQFFHTGTNQACVVAINTKPQVKQSLTNSKDIVKEAIERLTLKEFPIAPPGQSQRRGFGGTSLYDSIWFACEEILSKTPEDARRAILLLSDGVDTTSEKDRRKVSDHAIRSGVAIYTIGIGDPGMGGVDRQTLSGLAESTGGRAFFPNKTSELHESVEQIGQELKACFLVSYRSNGLKPAASGRKLKIEITNPDLRKQKLELAYQRKHFAR